MAGRSVVLLLLAGATCVLCSNISQENQDGLTKAVNALYNIYEKCDATNDLYSCIKIRALKFADRALKVSSIPLVSGLNLVKNEGVEEARSAALSEFDENLLPNNFDRKHEILDEFLSERISKFLNTHSVQVNLPKIMEEAVLSDKEATAEGRGKLKKWAGPLLVGAMFKGGMMAYALKAVGILAAKALMVSKIALVLASIVALKKIVGGGGGGHESKTIEIVSKPQVSHSHTYSSGHDFGGQWEGSAHSGGGGGGGGGFGRSFDSQPNVVPSVESEAPVGAGVDSIRRSAQEIAYRGRRLHNQQ